MTLGGARNNVPDEALQSESSVAWQHRPLDGSEGLVALPLAHADQASPVTPIPVAMADDPVLGPFKCGILWTTRCA